MLNGERIGVVCSCTGSSVELALKSNVVVMLPFASSVVIA